MGSFLQLGHGLADRRRDSEHIRGAGAHAILENVFRRIYYLALRVGSMEIASADGGEVGEGEGANLNLSVFHHFSLMPLLPWLLKRIAFTKPASHTATASAVVPFAYMATARANLVRIFILEYALTGFDCASRAGASPVVITASVATSLH